MTAVNQNDHLRRQVEHHDENPDRRRLRTLVESSQHYLKMVDDDACRDGQFSYKQGKAEHYRRVRGEMLAVMRVFDDVLQRQHPVWAERLRVAILNGIANVGHDRARERVAAVRSLLQKKQTVSLTDLLVLYTASAMEDKNGGAFDMAREMTDGVTEVMEELLEPIFVSLNAEIAQELPKRIVKDKNDVETEVDDDHYLDDLLAKVIGDLALDENLQRDHASLQQAYVVWLEHRK